MFFDHIGGIDTLFYLLSNASTLVVLLERTPEKVAEAIQNYQVEVLPVTPTFLNLFLISEVYKHYNLNSLKYITYGSEPMPEYILRRCNQLFPNILFLQKYGTTEVGTLRSKSLNSDSTWVRIGGEGYKTRIVNNILQIKAESSMLGYLNAPNPFTEDGWFITGDYAIEKDGYIKILGRESEIINVGGDKVYPAEVENVILELKFISDVTVYGEKNLLMGNIVCADVLIKEENLSNSEMKKIIKKHCQTKLESFKVPIKIYFVNNKQYSERFKKKRNFDIE